MIRMSQEARGLELTQKEKLMKRVKGNLQIIIPLIFSSLKRIDMVSTAMELRRFGKNKKRTWYTYKNFTVADILTITVSVILVLITVLLFEWNHGRFYNPWQ